MEKKTLAVSTGIMVLVLLIAVFNIGKAMANTEMDMKHMDADEKRATMIALKESIQHDLMPHHQYRCCLEKACTYCIEKTPGHGEGAVCDCLSDLVNGVHPCGECIGEILEGHGNPYLAEYYARAIGEKVGEQHIGTLRSIISEKYGIPVEEQA